MRRRRALVAALLLACLCLPSTACGGAAGGALVPGLGTLSLVNATNLGMAPLTIEQFVFVRQDSAQSPSNLLVAPVQPGGVVIVGLFAEGTYDGLAVVTGGLGVPFNDVVMRAGEPTTLTLP